ncbi:hypothetical protein EDB87DRAFT_1420251 [Lactarius vividus]|nr:hypothetical protein EDB87DRAFT_1420251 [Lactarius vividus]
MKESWSSLALSFPFFMDSYRPQPINAYTDRADGQSRPVHSWLPAHVSGPERYSQPSNTSSLQSNYTSPQQSDISSQSYYSARESPSNSTNSASTPSSDMSFPYSVTSINSRKSHKNVLYPRRERPLPVAATSEHSSISLDALIWRVRFLCTALLPYAETRLVPAGRVLLQSLGVHGYFSKRVPVRTDEETRCCAELFIALAHEILLKDAVSAMELEGPCKVLHTTFKDILSKSGAFSFPKTPKSNKTGLKAPTAGALTLWQFSSVLLTLFSVLNTFEVLYQPVRAWWRLLTIRIMKSALNTIKVKPATAKDGALRVYYRTALQELSVSTGLTIEQYRKKLDQNLAQTQAQLKSLGQPEGLLHPSTSATPVIPLYKGVPQAISTIEEDSEAEDEWNFVDSNSQSYSTESHSDSGKRSLPRKFLRRLIPSSMGRKEG